MMKFTAPLTGNAAALRGEGLNAIEFDLGTPGPDTSSHHMKKGWFARKLCRHEFEPLGERVGIYFYQERMGWAYHYACPKCGDICVIETDSMQRPNLNDRIGVIEKIMMAALLSPVIALVIFIITLLVSVSMEAY